VFDHTDPGLPQARAERLLTRAVPDGLIVYDTDRHQAHRLNHAAALVWQRCDGRTTVPELATLLRRELDLPADEALIWLALSRLEQAHLLHERVTPGVSQAGLSRRAMIRKLGIGGGVAALLPLVETLAAPAPAQAASAAIAGAAVRSNAAANKTGPNGPNGPNDPGSGNPTGNDPPASSGGDNSPNQNSSQNQNSQNQNNENQNSQPNQSQPNNGQDSDSPSNRPLGGGNSTGSGPNQGPHNGGSGGAGQAVLKEGPG
jgi:Coenzyme PQQ synthesis protein D (PqqD)